MRAAYSLVNCTRTCICVVGSSQQLVYAALVTSKIFYSQHVLLFNLNENKKINVYKILNTRHVFGNSLKMKVI